MPINLTPDIPGVCDNKDCENYKCFELYAQEDLKKDGDDYYFICYYCGKKIPIT